MGSTPRSMPCFHHDRQFSVHKQTRAPRLGSAGLHGLSDMRTGQAVEAGASRMSRPPCPGGQGDASRTLLLHAATECRYRRIPVRLSAATLHGFSLLAAHWCRGEVAGLQQTATHSPMTQASASSRHPEAARAAGDGARCKRRPRTLAAFDITTGFHVRQVSIMLRLRPVCRVESGSLHPTTGQVTVPSPLVPLQRRPTISPIGCRTGLVAPVRCTVPVRTCRGWPCATRSMSMPRQRWRW